MSDDSGERAAARLANVQRLLTLGELAETLGIELPSAVKLIDQAGIALRRTRGRGKWLVRTESLRAALHRRGAPGGEVSA
ncbi:MAG: hypothetical protein HY331_05730 [Chloroflexi bacterium]|nr:hypothetical protein [Chloroflexota bacterium]